MNEVVKMSRITRETREKKSERFNVYSREKKNTKESVQNEKENYLLKNTVGDVMAKLISTVNWTYTSIFGRTKLNEQQFLNKEEINLIKSEDLKKEEEESMLSESLAPHLFGYTPQAVRLRQHFKDYNQNNNEKQNVLIGSLEKQKESSKLPMIPFSSYNENSFEKVNNSIHSNVSPISHQSLKYNSEKTNLNIKSLSNYSNSESKNFKKNTKKRFYFK